MTSVNATSTAQVYLLRYNRFLVPISGFLSPLFILITASDAGLVFILITLTTNVIICAVLLAPNMRSPTNILLVSIATSDALTGVWSLPVSVYLFWLGAYRDWLPHSWCFVYFCLTEHLPTVFHTISVWLTVGLATQRYNYVCRPVSVRQLCTTRSVVRLVVVISDSYQCLRLVVVIYDSSESSTTRRSQLSLVSVFYDSYWSLVFYDSS